MNWEMVKRYAADDPYNSTMLRKNLREVAILALEREAARRQAELRAIELESWIRRNREWMHIDTVEGQILDDLLLTE